MSQIGNGMAGRRQALQRMAAGLGLGGMAVMVAGCVSALLPDHVDVTDDELRTALSRKMPWRKSVERLGELTVLMPELLWMPDKGRVGARFPLEWRDRGSKVLASGWMTVSLGLAIDDAAGGITAQAPALEGLRWDGLPELVTALVRPALNLWVRESLQGAVLHAWTPSQKEQMSRYHLRPKGIEVLDRALRIQLQKGA